MAVTAPDGAADPAAPLLDRVARSERPVAYALAGLGLAFVVASTWCAVRSYRADLADAAATQTTFAITFGVLGLLLAGAGVLFYLPAFPQEEPRSRARLKLLIAGGTLGLAVTVFGLMWSYLTRDALAAWVAEDKAATAWRFLVPLTLAVAGLAGAFLSIQLARPAERTDVTLRRLVYGFNAATSGFVLLLVLAAVNILAYKRLPGYIDTTAVGFSTLDPASVKLVKDLDREVRAYFIFPEQGQGFARGPDVYRNTRALLDRLQDLSPKFTYRYLSRLRGDEIDRLAREFRQYTPDVGDDAKYGVLLTVKGPGGERLASFVPAAELTTEQRLQTRGGRPVIRATFQGEGLIVNELNFLAQSRVKPVVYFVVGSGQVSADPAYPSPSGRTCRGLVGYLERRNFVVKTLPWADTTADPRVPTDASVLVIADPVRPLPPPQAKAVRDYLKPQVGPGKPLFLLASTHSAYQTRSGPRPTGLEQVLTENGVSVSKDYLVSTMTRRDGRLTSTARVALADAVPQAGLSPGERRQRANALGEAYDGRRPRAAQYPRPVTAGDGPLQELPLWRTAPRAVSSTWRESLPLDGPTAERRRLAFSGDPDLQARKRFTADPVTLGVLVQELRGDGPPRPAMAVYGFSQFMTDQDRRGSAGRDDEGYRLFADTLDWLRGRPAGIGVKPRVFDTYKFENEVDMFGLFWAPTLVMMVGIAGLGFGVWITRRR